MDRCSRRSERIFGRSRVSNKLIPLLLILFNKKKKFQFNIVKHCSTIHSDLKLIEDDFEHLKIYLNDSYNANDFYIKDIVMMGVYVIDELSLRSHIQSLPNIINEIWEIMGESGEAIRNSILWIIETIKNAYQKLSEIISAILRGDSMNQIASIVEKLIIKYDLFVKELHVSFIKYIEYLYNKIYQSISLQVCEDRKSDLYIRHRYNHR